MPSNPPIPDTLDEVVAEIASILAQGYLRHRKRRRIPPESGGKARKAERSLHKNDGHYQHSNDHAGQKLRLHRDRQLSRNMIPPLVD